MSVKLTILMALSLLMLNQSVLAEEASRGQLLYENHCKRCHEESVHTRDEPKAKNVVDLSRWVIRWQYDQKLEWDYDAIREVIQYLNRTYYKFPQTP